ncbi:MAG: hypothetical protein IKO11_04690 [Lachnospiraceae bacterium]|nr:hypothetical protein [Lachnospiraceae bacterium]
MKEITDVVYHFSEKEFLILLASAQVEHLPCFAGEHASVADITQEEYNRELFGLAKRGMLESRGDALYMPEKYSRIFRTIRQRKLTLSLYDPERLLYFYIGNDSMAVEAQSGAEVGAYVRLGFLEKDALSQRIRDELPQAMVPDSVYKKGEEEQLPEDMEECGGLTVTDGREEPVVSWKFYEWRGKYYTGKDGEEKMTRFLTEGFYNRLMEIVEERT